MLHDARHQRPARLLVVTDHPLSVHGIRAALIDVPVTAGFIGGRHAIAAAVQDFGPTAVLVDARADGLEIDRLAEATAAAPDATRLLLTNRLDDARLDVAFAAGAQTVLARSLALERLGRLLAAAATTAGLALARQVVVSARRPLTSRERRILGLAEAGHTNDQIARRLAVTEELVKSDRASTHRLLAA